MWSRWTATGFAGFALTRAHDREAVDVELQAADRDGARSRVIRTRLVARVPATFDCKTRPYGAYPSKCLGDATPPMGD